MINNQNSFVESFYTDIIYKILCQVKEIDFDTLQVELGLEEYTYYLALGRLLIENKIVFINEKNKIKIRSTIRQNCLKTIDIGTKNFSPK